LFNGASGAANVQEGQTGDPVVSTDMLNGMQNVAKGENAVSDEQQANEEANEKDRSAEQNLDVNKSQNEESNEKVNRIRTVISKVRLSYLLGLDCDG
jgi:hypothetical protein